MDHCENCGGEYERLLSEEEDGGGGERITDDRADDCRELSAIRQQLVGTGQKIAYGLGHVFNDITATIWFSYTMVFMQNVVGMPPTMAGFLLFFGK